VLTCHLKSIKNFLWLDLKLEFCYVEMKFIAIGKELKKFFHISSLDCVTTTLLKVKKFTRI